MGFEDALKNPIYWMRREPAVFLLAVINWLPGLLMLPIAATTLPQVQKLLAKADNDVTVLFTRHFGELIQTILPSIVIGVIVLVAAALVKALISLALANAAVQLRESKPLRLSDALTEAKNQWARLLLAILASVALFLGVFAVIVLLFVLAFFAASAPVIGILLAIILAIAAIVVALIAAVAFSTMFLILPACIVSQNTGAQSTVKSVFEFVKAHKLQSAGLFVLVAIVQYGLGQVSFAGFPYLWIVIPMSMLVDVLASTWTGLFAAEFWFQYNAKPTSASQAAKTESDSTVPDAAAKKDKIQNARSSAAKMTAKISAKRK